MAGKKQHVIPQLHLRRFVGHDPPGHIWIYDAEAEEPRSATPANTAVETHFYSVEMDDGTMNSVFDDYITDVEGKAASIYEEITYGRIPGKDQKKADFSTFLSVMYFRTSAMRRLSAEYHARVHQTQMYTMAAHDDTFEAFVLKFEKRINRNLRDEEKESLRKGMLNPGENYDLAIPKVKTLIAIQGADYLAEIIFQMRWSVGEAKHGFFTTSDNPVMRRIDSNTHHPLYGDHGFLNNTVRVTFPLTPKRLLVLTWKEFDNQIFSIPRNYVDDENEARAAHSERYLYAHIKYKQLMNMARKFKGFRPSIQPSGFGPKKFAEVKVPRKWSK